MSAQLKLAKELPDQSTIFDETPADVVDRRLSILNVKVADYSAVRSGGSIGAISWADISAALSYAKLNDINYMIVRVIHCGDVQSIIKLVSLMTDKVIETKRTQGKEICGGKKDDVRKLVSVALFDFLQPTDKRPVSIRHRASIAGIAQTTYRRLGHDATVDSIIEQMSDRYAYARACIHNQLVSQ